MKGAWGLRTWQRQLFGSGPVGRTRRGRQPWRFVLAGLLALVPAAVTAAPPPSGSVRAIVDAAVRTVMAEYEIPGMAVGIAAEGKTYVFNYGVTSRDTGRPVSTSTLFEIGSVSKTFTVTLAAWAEAQGRLSLTDTVDTRLPEMRGTAFGKARLYQLAAHTAGGFPLQVPDGITNMATLTAYLRQWTPEFPPDTQRTYSNVSIGMLGVITARVMDEDFTALMQRRLFPSLGLPSTYIHVPASRLPDYAQGYTKTGEPIRLQDAVLSPEAYGVRTTARDLLHFVQANMGEAGVESRLRRALDTTHTPYFQAGGMTQDLIWEQYPYPVALDTPVQGNSSAMALNATPVTRLDPSRPSRPDVWINKTGSTNGFGAYVSFIPTRKIGVVILANKNYPNEARIRIAHRIVSRLDVSRLPR